MVLAGSVPAGELHCVRIRRQHHAPTSARAAPVSARAAGASGASERARSASERSESADPASSESGEKKGVNRPQGKKGGGAIIYAREEAGNGSGERLGQVPGTHAITSSGLRSGQVNGVGDVCIVAPSYRRWLADGRRRRGAGRSDFGLFQDTAKYYRPVVSGTVIAYTCLHTTC